MFKMMKNKVNLKNLSIECKLGAEAEWKFRMKENNDALASNDCWNHILILIKAFFLSNKISNP